MHTSDLLTLTQWMSPSFPVGAFAYSHGLEVAIADGRVAQAAALRGWLEDVLQSGTGRSDAILLRAAYGGAAAEADRVGRAFAGSVERLQEGLLQGAAFATTVRAVWGLQVDDALYPVAVGQAAALRGLPEDLVISVYLQSFVGNLVSAAVRAVPLGQTAGQAVLAELSEAISDVVDGTFGAALDDLSSCAFLSDIAAMRHETLEPRIFRT